VGNTDRSTHATDVVPAAAPAEPHVYSVEWTAWERVFAIDGEEDHRERRGVVLPRQRIVRSVLTCDYEVVEVVERLTLAPDLGSPHASPACDRAAAGRRRP